MKRRIYAKKSLGQHYLRDKNIKNKIIKSLDLNPNDTVVEIGCGRGALTDLIIGKVGSDAFKCHQLGMTSDQTTMTLAPSQQALLLKDGGGSNNTWEFVISSI